MQHAESTALLLERARAGDPDALDALFARYLPAFRRWASGRLPAWARGGADTQDLVQDVVLKTLRKIEAFEPRHEGALQAYLRQALLNRIRDEMRGVLRRGAQAELETGHPDPGPSPLESAVGREGIERYERALASLRPEEAEAVIGRLEMGYSYPELAEVIGKPSGDAARMTVERAIVRLIEAMKHGG
jgi:RNA polymerase sigma-70 factor, ECF subfamily